MNKYFVSFVVNCLVGVLLGKYYGEPYLVGLLFAVVWVGYMVSQIMIGLETEHIQGDRR